MKSHSLMGYQIHNIDIHLTLPCQGPWQGPLSIQETHASLYLFNSTLSQRIDKMTGFIFLDSSGWFGGFSGQTTIDNAETPFMFLLSLTGDLEQARKGDVFNLCAFLNFKSPVAPCWSLHMSWNTLKAKAKSSVCVSSSSLLRRYWLGALCSVGT